MNKLLKLTILFALSLLVGAALAQTTVTSATITDSDGFLWTNAQYTVTFVPNPSYPNTNQYTLAGHNLASYAPYTVLLNQTGATNGSGVLSITLLDNTQILPSGSTWKFNIQSNSSAPATSYNPIQVYGGTISLTTYLSSNTIAPRFPAILGAFGYGDVELTTTPNPGGQYFNTTTLTPRFWNGTVWANFGSGGATTINGQTSPFTFNGTVSNVGSTFTFTGGSGSFNLNTAEMGAYSSGALTHTGDYVVPLGQTTSQINALFTTSGGVYQFQLGDTVANKFTNPFSNGQYKAYINHNGLAFYTNSINWDNPGVVCDARQIPVTFTSGSNTITTSSTIMSTLDVGRVMWAWNSTTNSAYETQIQTQNGAQSFTVATNAPWTQGSAEYVWIGTDNTTNEQAALTNEATQVVLNGAGYGEPAAALTMSAGSCMSHTLNPSGVSLTGAGVITNLVSPPGEDTFNPGDGYTTGIYQGNVHLNNFAVTLEGGVDATQPWTLYNDAHPTGLAQTALYRPAYVMTKNSNNILAPQWCIGPNQNNVGCLATVALTNGTTLACFPATLASNLIPAVGQALVAPYTSSGLIETTVSSTSGSCSGGATARTLGVAIPSGSQTEFIFGTTIQSTAADFPASRTYPFQLVLTQSILPGPGAESDIAPYGLFQIGAEQCNYYNINFATNALTITGCTGTAVDHPSGSYIAPLNPFKPTYPWPVTPTINTNDTTPANTASFYPGHNIGNCAWAFPQSNGLANSYESWSNGHIENITINQINLPNYNNTCDFYFVAMPYATHFNDIRMIGSQYAVIQGSPSIENHTWFTQQPTADGSSWKGITARSGYIFDFINANQNTFDNWDSYSQLGNSSGTTVGCAGGFFTSYGWDDQTGAATGAMTLSHLSNMYVEPESGTHCEQEALLELDGFNNVWTDLHMGGGGFVYLGGLDQEFIGGNFNNGGNGGTGSPPVVNYANGATFFHTELVGASPACNTFTSAFPCEFINWGPKTHMMARTEGAGNGPYGSEVYGNNRTVPDGQTNETFNTGNLTAPYVHSGWGYIDPSEFEGTNYDAGGFNHNLWTFDSTATVSQANVGCTVGNSQSIIYCNAHRFNTSGIYIGPGQRLTNGWYMVYISAKSTLATNTLYFGVSVVSPASVATSITGPIAIASTNAYPTTLAGTWQVAVNLSSYNGYTIRIDNYGASSADVDYIQFVDFAPIPENYNVRQLTVQGSGAPTYVNGTNGTETWQPAAPSGVNGCGSTYPNGSIWHNLAGTHGSSTLTYVCNGGSTTWVGVF